VVEADAPDELLFELGVDGRFGSPALVTALGLDRPRPANTVVLAVTDRFATALFEPPADDPAAVFRDGAMFTDASGSMGPDNPPLYVASVSYGRQLLLAVRSALPQADLRAALEGAVAGAPPSSEARPGLTFQAIIATAELHASVRGPLSVQPMRDAPPAGAYEALRQLLAARAPTDGGEPVGYTLKYLVDGEPAAMTFATHYRQIRCVPMPDRPFTLAMTGSNIDKDLYVWLESPGGNDLLLYSNEPGGGVVNLNLALDRHGAAEGVIQMKVGNGDCFHASGSLAITVDGVTRWSLETDKALSDCGWQLEGRVRVNQTTGKLEELLRWLK
jgi:hypothetical protein